MRLAAHQDDHLGSYADAAGSCLHQRGGNPAPGAGHATLSAEHRADTMVTDYLGRAVAFATGDPSGLAATLPDALAQLRQVLGAEAKILLGFDRGGSYPVALRGIRDAHADWIIWRRGPLAPVTAAPRRYWAARGDGKPARCSGWPRRP
jgi:hypothetical protein